MIDLDAALPVVLPLRTLELPVAGRNLRPWTLGEQLGADSTLLVFLPDLDAPTSRAVVGDLHLATDLWGGLSPTIFVHADSAEAGDTFFNRLHTGARVVADPSRRLFEAFGVASRRVPRFSGLRGLSRHLSARWGREDGQPVRDLPDVPILVQLEGTVASWSEPYGIAGARPELDRILRLARIVARARDAGRAA